QRARPRRARARRGRVHLGPRRAPHRGALLRRPRPPALGGAAGGGGRMTDPRVVKEAGGDQLLRLETAPRPDARPAPRPAHARPARAPARLTADDIWGNPLPPEQAPRKFEQIRQVLGDAGCPRGKVVVEIGAGMSLGMGLVALALGAERAILLDRDCYLQDDA